MSGRDNDLAVVRWNTPFGFMIFSNPMSTKNAIQLMREKQGAILIYPLVFMEGTEEYAEAITLKNSTA